MFWFWFTIHISMLVANAAWWKVSMRLTEKRRWRVLVSVFIAWQMIVLLLAMCRRDGPMPIPQAVFLGAVIWNYLVLALALAVLLPRQIVRMFRGPVRAVTHVEPEDPVAAPASANSQTRREFIGACAALAPPLFSIGLTGAVQAELNQLNVRRLTLAMPTLPRDLDGLTIAHLSDIHVGGFTSGRVLRDMVNTTNALRPDLVVMTGDLINFDLADLSEGISLLKAMESRYGLWMIEGNHDLFDNGREFQRRVKAAGVPLLVDESAVAHVRGHPVQFFGLSWVGNPIGMDRERDSATSSQLGALLKQRQPDAFPILLAHHPHAFDAAVKAGLPLTLSGHTHGGFWMLNNQIGLGPAIFRYWSGHYERGGGQLVVSNGIGNFRGLPPIRINAPAEIVHITLRCAADHA